MAGMLRVVDYYYVRVPDRPGAGAHVLSVLRRARVKLLAVHAFPAGREVQVDLVPADPARFLRAARAAGLRLSRRKQAFLVEGSDRVGVLVPALQRIAAARINLTALTALRAGRGRYGAIFWVKPGDVRRTRALFGRAGRAGGRR